MPDGQTVAGAHPRRPARRGCRGGWRVRRAKARGSGDQLTAPGVGVPDGPFRVGRQQTPPSHARTPAPPAFAYHREHLLAVRDRPTAAQPVQGVIRAALPARLSGLIRRSHRTSHSQTRRTAARPTPCDTRKPSSSRSLKIGHVNARSLIPKLDQILKTVLDNDLDILCLTETWLTETVSDRILVFPGYKLLRRDRPLSDRLRSRTAKTNRGGGVAILCRESLKCVALPIVSSEETCESLWVTVSGGGRCSATVGVMYRPPSYLSSDSLAVIHDQLREAAAIGKPLFCLGDFNIDLLRPDSPAVRHYTSILSDLNLFQLVKTPTHLHPSASLIDHIITTVPRLENNVTVLPVPIADHLTTILCAPIKRLRSRPQSFRARCWNKVNWNALCLHLLLADWAPFHQAVNIDCKLKVFMQIWSTAVDQHCPLKTVRQRRARCPWLVNNHDLHRAMNQRDEAFRVWRNTGTESAHDEYRRLRNMDYGEI